jgi:hypothetical protein
MVSLTDSHHEPIPTDHTISTEHNLSCIALIENTGNYWFHSKTFEKKNLLKTGFLPIKREKKK